MFLLIFIVSSKQKSLKQPHLPQESLPSTSVGAHPFLQHHLFLRRLNFPLHRPMRFNHTCSRNLLFYFLFLKGYNLVSVLPAHTVKDLIYLSTHQNFKEFLCLLSYDVLTSFSPAKQIKLSMNKQKSLPILSNVGPFFVLKQYYFSTYCQGFINMYVLRVCVINKVYPEMSHNK